MLVDVGYYLELTMSILNVVLLYWISILGVLQKNVTSLISNDELGTEEEVNYINESERKKSPANSKRTQQLITTLKSHLHQEEVFTKSDLTIADVAQVMNVHPRVVSDIINNELNENFNGYVNHLRIQKAKELFLDKSNDYLSIEGVGQEVGFRSKSSFYASFKKTTGKTPTEYKTNER